ASQIAALGFDPYVNVYNPETVDVTPPEFRSVEFSSNEVDVSNGEVTVTVRVSVFEAESEPNHLSLSLTPPTGIPSSQSKQIIFFPTTGQGWQATSTAGVYTHESTVTFDANSAAGVWSAKVDWIGDTNSNTDYKDVTASQIAALGFDPYITVKSSEPLMDLQLLVNSANQLSKNDIVSSFLLSIENAQEKPTSFEFKFDYSDELSYRKLSVIGASSTAMSCSVYFGSGSCDVSVSDDWESLFFNLEFAPGALGINEVNAEVIFQGYEADSTNNSATHTFVSKVIRPARNDVNGDSKSDILWRSYAKGWNFLWTMDGIQTSGVAPINVVPEPSWDMVGQGDYNYDGKSDIFWRNRNTGQNFIYQMDGSSIKSRYTLNYVSATDWIVAGSGDFDGDGTGDVMWRNINRGDTWFYLMDNGVIGSSLPSEWVTDLNYRVAAIGDIDGDGDDDVIWRNGITGDNDIWLMQDGQIAEKYSLNTANSDWDIAGTGDLDGDGTDDIILRNQVDGRNWVYFMENGQIRRSTLINTVADTNWEIANIGDYDGDGKADFLWRHVPNARNLVHLMDGTAIKAKGVLRPTDSTWQVGR
ncbi:Repeat domain-containing protein, partial [Marisediminitalea aggregata]